MPHSRFSIEVCMLPQVLVYVMLFGLPLLYRLAEMMEKLDRNPEGADDIAARAIRSAITELELWIISKGEGIVIPQNAEEIVLRYSEQIREEAATKGVPQKGKPPVTKPKS